MTNRTLQLTPELAEYILSVSLREPKVLADLRKETAKLDNHRMQIAPEQGQFMALLARMINARKVLELGTYTGYSALVLALALPEDGKLITCDINPEWTAMAKLYWQKAKIEHKIELRLAPAIETLDELLAQTQANSFDFAFIDADKTNYPHYYERVLQLVRIGGVILIDNVLQQGQVLEPYPTRQFVRIIKAFNEQLHADDRVHLSMLPISDGLTLLCKLK